MLDILNKLLNRDETPAPKGKTAAAPVKPATSAVPADPQADLFSISRIDLLQKMWGEGYVTPGGTELIKDLAKPIGLDPQKSVLDFNAGLGGAGRALVTFFKTYVTSFERDLAMATEGQKITQFSGFSRTAPVIHYNPHDFVYNKKVDAVMFRDFLYTLKDKDDFVSHAAATLKPRGHLIMTDYVCPADLLDHPSVSLWIDSEPRTTRVISDRETIKLLEKYGFDVRVSEDMSAAYTNMVLQGLAKVPKILEGKTLSKQAKDVVRDEVDIWSKRMNAVTAGVKYVRYYAIKING